MAKLDVVLQKIGKVEEKAIAAFYGEQYRFVANLLKHIPRLGKQEEDDDTSTSKKNDLKNLPKRLYPGGSGEKKPARTVEELQAKLANLKGKSKLAYKDKLVKKGLKNRLKKREKKEDRKLKKIALRAEKKVNLGGKNQILKSAKPVVSKEGKIIFSKFDFTDVGNQKPEHKNPIKDPVVALRKIKEQNEKLKAMKEAGKEEKVAEVLQKKAWKTALLKSEGVKVKNDPELLQKTIKKQKGKKEKSHGKWKAREEKLMKEKDEKQRKRTENIQERARQKKLGKMKKAAKRGKVVAGF